ncbi:MAG: hypothetical protein L0L30_17710, partial [Brevibacterium sp.]|nr:hypothetical protein [Brevibacterium sp.]
MTLTSEVDPRANHNDPSAGTATDSTATTGPAATGPATSSTGVFDPDRLIDERRPGYCLDAPFYLSDEFYRRDIAA